MNPVRAPQPFRRRCYRLIAVLWLSIGVLFVGGADSVFAQPVAESVPPATAGHPEARSLDARAHRLAKAIAADIERVEPVLERYGYWAVFLAVGVEGMGIPMPGQTLLEAGAVVAAAPDSRLDIYPLLFITILATALGQTLGYLIGRSGGRAVLNRLPIPAHSLDNIEQRFKRYGGWLVVFGRFVDGPRQLIGIFSGVLAMPWRRFMLLNVAGAILWAGFWALGVYYLDLHLDAIVTALRHLNPWIAGLTLIGLVALLLSVIGVVVRQRRRQQD